MVQLKCFEQYWLKKYDTGHEKTLLLLDEKDKINSHPDIVILGVVVVIVIVVVVVVVVILVASVNKL